MKTDKLKISYKYEIKLTDHEMPDENWIFEEILLAKTKDVMWFLNLEDVGNVSFSRIEKFLGLAPKKYSDIKLLQKIDKELFGSIDEIHIDKNGKLSNDMGDTIKIKKCLGKSRRNGYTISQHGRWST
jgi:hypothetical protein